MSRELKMPLVRRDFGSMQMAVQGSLCLLPMLMVSVFMALGSTTKPATEEEIESVEKKMDNYEKNEAYAKHIILSSTSPRLSLRRSKMNLPC